MFLVLTKYFIYILLKYIKHNIFFEKKIMFRLEDGWVFTVINYVGKKKVLVASGFHLTLVDIKELS